MAYQGTYYDDDTDDCEDCPTGATCDIGSTIQNLYIDPGYWRYSEDSLYIYECPAGDAACGGGNHSSGYCTNYASGPYCIIW